MDFTSLLDTAVKNTKNISKTLNDLDSEVVRERKSHLKQLEAEKKAKLELIKKRGILPKREPDHSEKFKIPKKAGGSSIDKLKVTAFLAKKEEEKRKRDKQKLAEKERLIQLRLQANGGKANKKIGKHFGMNAIDLQIRYGHDHEHVEKLQKQKWKEDEEHDKLSAHYRDGVYKAIAQKKKLDDKARSTISNEQKQPHRIATSKANSLMGLSSRHAHSRDVFSPPPEYSKSKTTVTTSEIKQKKEAPTVIDFSTLMKAAQNISEGKETHLDFDQRPNRKPILDEKKHSKSKASFIPHSSMKQSCEYSSTIKRPENCYNPVHQLSKMSSKSDKATDMNPANNMKYSNNRLKKPSTPVISTTVSEKKYLPGDIRYKPTTITTKHIDVNVASSSSRSSGDSERIVMQSLKRGQKPSVNYINKPRQMNHIRQVTSIDKNRYRQKKHEQLQTEHKSNLSNRAYNYDEVEDEDDYDSDMDDFIDDTGLDMDELSRQEFEETLKMVNPKYDQKKWRERERMISERNMVANFRTISKEEARSARIGMIEDIKEATKGNSVRL